VELRPLALSCLWLSIYVAARWFEEGNLITSCWTASGTLEQFTFTGGSTTAKMNGTINGAPGLVATKKMS